MSLIKIPTSNTSDFPLEIFSTEIQENFKEISSQRNIPLNYLGSTALYSIAALSGNMFITELNGDIKPIIYSFLIGPSGVGKTPAYNIICGDIVAPYEKQLYLDFKNTEKEWLVAKEFAKKCKEPFNQNQPYRRVRTAEGGTMEGIMRHAMNCPAGFGLYYDEGGTMFSGPNAFKREGSATDFWNAMWNGKPSNQLRADAALERHVSGASISVLAGMQTDRLGLYFTPDAIKSGLPGRFLMTISDYIPLNENVDHFNTSRREACAAWKEKIIILFRKGANNFFQDDKPYFIPFETAAAEAFDKGCSMLIKASNIALTARAIGDVNDLMITYEAKLYAYFGRFAMLLSILDNQEKPIITKANIQNAWKLCKFYRAQALKIFTAINNENQTLLTENEQLLYDSLPETFTGTQAKSVCEVLKLNIHFFETAFRRKYENIWIMRVGKGKYQKIN